MTNEIHSSEKSDENNMVLVERLKREAIERDEERRQAVAREWEEHPERKEAFIKEIQQRIKEEIIEGFLNGWWDLDDDGNMIAPPQKFKISDFPENATMGHVMAAAAIFPSISQARKNGWGSPLVAGEFTVTKKKIRIIVLDE